MEARKMGIISKPVLTMGQQQMLRQEYIYEKCCWSITVCFLSILSFSDFHGVGAPELEIASLNMEFVMDFLPLVCPATWTFKLNYMFCEDIMGFCLVGFFCFEAVFLCFFLNVSYSWNNQKLFRIYFSSVTCDLVEVCPLLLSSAFFLPLFRCSSYRSSAVFAPHGYFLYL